MRMTLLLAMTGLLITGAPAYGDPTRPPSPAEIQAWQAGHTADAPESGWQLQSVLISETRQVAVINGQRYRVGDRIGQAQLVAIEPGRVTLRHEGERLSLTIASRTHRVHRTSND